MDLVKISTSHFFNYLWIENSIKWHIFTVFDQLKNFILLLTFRACSTALPSSLLFISSFGFPAHYLVCSGFWCGKHTSSIDAKIRKKKKTKAARKCILRSTLVHNSYIDWFYGMKVNWNCFQIHIKSNVMLWCSLTQYEYKCLCMHWLISTTGYSIQTHI